MKTAIYLDQGTTQVVLTPENPWEENVLRLILETPVDKLQQHFGGFYRCQGDWIRHNRYSSDDKSLIFVVEKQTEFPNANL